MPDKLLLSVYADHQDYRVPLGVVCVLALLVGYQRQYRQSS